MSAAASEPSEPHNWVRYSILVGTLALALCTLIMVQRVHHAGNRHTRTLHPSSAFAQLYVRVSFTLLPYAWAIGFGLLIMVGNGLEIATGEPVFGWLIGVGAIGMFASFGWSVKEYVRPSRWRQVPDWLYEQELLERPKA